MCCLVGVWKFVSFSVWFSLFAFYLCVHVCWSLPMHLHAEGKRVINHCLCVRAYVFVFLAFSAHYETLLVLTVGMDGSHYLWCRPLVTACCHQTSCQLSQDGNRTNAIWLESDRYVFEVNNCMVCSAPCTCVTEREIKRDKDKGLDGVFSTLITCMCQMRFPI